MASLVPPINTRGIYTLKSPFQARNDTVYTTAALRRFIDLENQGVDVYSTYYVPFDLERSVYERDRRDNVLIVTLTSDRQAPIYVPSSYIEGYPSFDDYKYHHVVLSVSLGLLPDTIDLTFAKDQVSSVVSDTTGVTPTVFEDVVAYDGVVSSQQHESLTAARNAAINNRTTDRARVLRLTNDNQQLRQRLQIAEDLLKRNGII